MKTIATFCLICACSLGLQAQKSFDPETDTIALTNQQGIWKIIVPEKTLIASAQLVTPNLSSVHDIRVQDIHNKPYLFFRGQHRDMPEFGFTLMVQLTEISKGIWKTGAIYQVCWGDTCSECGFDEYWGCSCERYNGAVDEPAASYCNHMVALGMGLKKIIAPD